MAEKEGQDLELSVTSARELRAMTFGGIVHRRNLADPFVSARKKLMELVKFRRKWARDKDGIRKKRQDKRGTALVYRVAILEGSAAASWKPGPILHELPKDHGWAPNEEDLTELVMANIFEVKNSANGKNYPTGDDPEEFNLRKCCCLDLLEFRGDLRTLLKAWVMGKIASNDPAADEVKAVARPKKQDGTEFNPRGIEAVQIKREAARIAQIQIAAIEDTQ